MVTEVKRYVASDGKEFSTRTAAEHHDIATEFLRAVRPDSANRQVYEAIINALKYGWTLTPPRPEVPDVYRNLERDLGLEG